MKQKDWQEFESIVEQIHRQLVPDGDIVRNHIVKGRCGIYRQLDVTIQQKLAGMVNLNIVECKKYKRKVSITEVEAFSRKRLDVKAQRGIMIANGGFTAGAKAIANYDDIILRTVEEAKATDWAQFNMPVSLTLIRRNYIPIAVFGVIDSSDQCIELSLDQILQFENEDPENMHDWVKSRIPHAQLTRPGRMDCRFETDRIPLLVGDVEYTLTAIVAIGEVKVFCVDVPIEPNGGVVMKDAISGDVVYAQVNTTSVDRSCSQGDAAQQNEYELSLDEYLAKEAAGIINLSEDGHRYLRVQAVYRA